MDLFIKLYLISWLSLTLIGLLVLIKNRNELLLFKKEYIKFILIKWKLVLFLIATILLCIMAGLGLDPTWDIPETIIMSILTYYTAPYSVGTIFRYIKGLNRNLYEFYISVILLFFSSAWFYDLYTLIFLLGEYPVMAFSNLLLSPFFYLLGGIMWNTAYDDKKGVILLFNEKEWLDYKVQPGNLSKIFIYLIPIFLFMIIIFGYFLYLNI